MSDNPSYSTMNDGCESMEEGRALREALGDGFSVLYENYDDHGYGHHNANAIFVTRDGRFISAECGGCSCQGSGSWAVVESREEAIRMVPEQERPEWLK